MPRKHLGGPRDPEIPSSPIGSVQVESFFLIKKTICDTGVTWAFKERQMKGADYGALNKERRKSVGKERAEGEL